VRLRVGTKLRAVLGVPALDVVSRHHQAIASVGERWSVAAVDDEDLIEAVERAGHPFAVGVQWHPEVLGDLRLYQALVAAAIYRSRSS